MSTKTKRMGRPPKDPADRATARIMVRLTPMTMAAVEQAANGLEIPTATLAADILRRWVSRRK